LSCCTLEICIGTAAAAGAAEQGGADRLELCAELAVGGTTPPPALLKATRAATRLPIIVLVRPRAGSFVYSTGELDRMRRQIDHARDGGADGVALGLLRPDRSVATEELGALVEHARAEPAKRLQICFHRAFDEIADKPCALEELVALGIERVLTSGGPPRAVDGLATLRELVDRAAGRITIMPGGGVRADDALRIAQESGCREIHSSAGMPAVGDSTAVSRLHQALRGD
jgi:copper homeostasis protein